MFCCNYLYFGTYFGAILNTFFKNIFFCRIKIFLRVWLIYLQYICFNFLYFCTYFGAILKILGGALLCDMIFYDMAICDIL